MNTNNGTEAQECVGQSLSYLEQYKRGSFLRLYDSTSAGVASGGNFLPGNPGDFIVMINGKGILLEVKSSIVHNDLKDCCLRNVFRDIQILGARMWRRGGGMSLCVFMALPKRNVEVWDMAPIVEAYLSPPRKRKLQGEPLYSGVWSIPSLGNEILNLT